MNKQYKAGNDGMTALDDTPFAVKTEALQSVSYLELKVEFLASPSVGWLQSLSHWNKHHDVFYTH